RSILGGRQEGWLYAGLANARSRWNLLAQGTLVGFDQEPAVTGRRVMTDAWNGFPASRTRLLRFLEEQRISNPVVLAGDIHAFVVGTLASDSTNPEAPPVAAELVTTSISSQGPLASFIAARREANPRILLAT